MTIPETVYIGLGSNLGDSAHILREGWELLGQHPDIRLNTISLPYLSSPVGMTSNFWFTNAVGRLETSCSAEGILDLLLATEVLLGRVRDEKKQGYQDREIDLDLLYYGSMVMDTPRLILPHPHRNDRLFVLEPMAAIAPDFVDPETGRSMAEMCQQLMQRIASGNVEFQEVSSGSWPSQRGGYLI